MIYRRIVTTNHYYHHAYSHDLSPLPILNRSASSTDCEYQPSYRLSGAAAICSVAPHVGQINVMPSLFKLLAMLAAGL